jgi:type I restriction enzyme S subunit
MKFEKFKWSRKDCAVFFKVAEENGGCSNMAGGMPIVVNNVSLRTSEALYQAMRFPDHPEIQREIIEQKSPMAAKMVTKPHLHLTRPDWDEARIYIMAWTVRVKLYQNPDTFWNVLKDTENRMIVEQSRKDDFWGAKVVDDDFLYGCNALGFMLSDMRDEVYTRGIPTPVLPFDNMMFLGEPIGAM